MVYYAAADSLFYFGGYIGSDMQDTVYQQRTHEQFGWQWIKVLGFMCIFLFCGDKQSVDTKIPKSSYLTDKMQRKRASHRSFVHNDHG